MIRSQLTNQVLMVRPAHFTFNADTAADNYFQQQGTPDDAAHALAVTEFDNMVELLRDNGITVEVVQDTPVPHTPDSIFPNNWFVTNSDGVLTLFPMHAPNRAAESRKPELYDAVVKAFKPLQTLDLRDHDRYPEGVLEGTGAMIIDRPHSVVYACRSQRITEQLLERFCEERGYEPVIFDALDRNGMPIYHTNVMMALGEHCAVICAEAIPADQRSHVLSKLTSTGHHIVEITLEQVYSFAGNMLFLRNGQGRPLLVMSRTAYDSLTPEQLEQLNDQIIVTPAIETIERLGGGSVRCMMAEIFRHD